MALVPGVMSAHFNDQYGIVGTVPVSVTVDDTKTVAQVMTDLAAYLNDTAALSDGNSIKATLSLEYLNPGSDPGAATGDIEKGGLFNFNNASDAYATGVLVPDLAAAVLNGSGLIDLSNAAVTTWITYLTTAHTAITVVTKGVRALTSLKDALIAFRKHRKPLERKTKEI